MAVSVCSANLASLKVPTPPYDRAKVTNGIVHIGMGGFHRAHQARYTDAVLSSDLDGASEWGISGVGLMTFDAKMRDVMAKQDCLYTLWARGGESDIRVIGAHQEFLFAPDQHATVVERLASASTKVVTLTITEKGYCSNLGTGELDATLDSVRSDLQALNYGSTKLCTAPGFLTAAAQRRKAAGAPPLAVLSCDNVQSNGDKMSKCALQFAELVGGAELRTYMEKEWTFPNSMVDRITPATNDGHRETLRTEHGIEDEWPVFCEDFIQWVVEDKFPSGRPPWEKVLGGSCLMVEDVLPYELMKLRLLNGSHQAVGFLGVLSGYRAVDDAMADPDVLKYIEAYMNAVEHSVPAVPGVNLSTYKAKLRERFSNVAIKDQLLRLTEDGRNRIEVACIPCLKDMPESAYLPVAGLVACWICYLAVTEDEKGQQFTHSPDTALEKLQPLAKELYDLHKHNDEKTEDVKEAGNSSPSDAAQDVLMANFLIAAFPDQDVAKSEVFASRVTGLLPGIINKGSANTLAAACEATSTCMIL